MEKNDSALYEAFCAKDARFDGRFFVGVSSSKIYCRPICQAKMPKKENCTFFSSAAEAESAGYCPCLLCRPELAPGRSAAEVYASPAGLAARMIEEDCGSGKSLEQMAKKLGCTGRHLRRMFEEEFHVSPIQYLQTCRLLLAKNLLTDTDLPMVDVAFASGFGSLRRFNDAFKEKYSLTPTEFRRQIPKEKHMGAGIRVSVGYRPPYRWDEMLRFLKERAILGVEAVKEGVYYRTVRIPDARQVLLAGWISVSNNAGRNVLEVRLSESLIPVLPQVLGRVRDMFDLYCDPEIIYRTLFPLNEIREGLCVEGIRLPGCFDPFELSVRAILGQQVTVKAAGTLAGRIVSKFGTHVNTPVEGLTHAFPTVESLLNLGEDIEDYLGPLGVIAGRARAIRDLAKAVTDGKISFDKCHEPEAEMKKLTAIKGIGEWTANYIVMRTLSWTDAFLETDAGIRHALPGRSPKELKEMSEDWRPWRSYAVMNLWNSLKC